MWLENMRVLHCIFTAPMLGQESALDVSSRQSRVQIGPPDEAAENNFNEGCGLGPLRRGNLLAGVTIWEGNFFFPATLSPGKKA